MGSEGPVKRYISWDQYQELYKNILDQVGYDQPQCIVGLTRGGLVPAVQLSHHFNVPLYVLNISLRDDMVDDHDFDWSKLEGYSNILIVDDINDSGATFTQVMEECYEHLIVQPRFATLLSKRSSRFNPGLAGEVINNDREDEWIVFPWE